MDEKIKVAAVAAAVAVIVASAGLLITSKAKAIRMVCDTHITTGHSSTKGMKPVELYKTKIVKASLGADGSYILPAPVGPWEYVNPSGCRAEDGDMPKGDDGDDTDAACACTAKPGACEVALSGGKWIPAPIAETFGPGYRYQTFRGEGCFRKSCGSLFQGRTDESWPSECPNVK